MSGSKELYGIRNSRNAIMAALIEEESDSGAG
jgi:hypothetical protein